MSITRREFGLMAITAPLATSTGASAQPAGMPAHACDCHVHIIGPQSRYPMDPNRVYTTPEASVADLLALRQRTGISRHVLVQPSFFGTDNRCMLDSLDALNNTARGVAVIADTVPEADLRAMHARGVRGVRLNLETGGDRDPVRAAVHVKAMAARVAPLRWHVQIYAALEVIAALAPTIRTLGVPVVVDHFALAMAAGGVGQPGFDTLLGLVRDGKIFVKLSAPHRISSAAPDYADVAPIARALIAAGPDHMLWGSDWPHTVRTPGKTAMEVHPFLAVDDPHNLVLLKAWTGTDAVFRRILVENPEKLYGFT